VVHLGCGVSVWRAPRSWGATGPEVVINTGQKCCELPGDRICFRLSIERGDDQGPIYTTVGSPSAITEVYTDPQPECVSGACTRMSYCYGPALFATRSRSRLSSCHAGGTDRVIDSTEIGELFLEKAVLPVFHLNCYRDRKQDTKISKRSLLWTRDWLQFGWRPL
jgi:hypothetical protein